jgi:predicted metalloendopeptidase
VSRSGWLFFTFLFIAAAAPPPRSGIETDAIDTACKPCDDFYRFANGGWLDRNPMPANQSRWGTFSIVGEGNSERLRTILEAAATAKPATGSNEQKIGDLYAACMDTARIEALGLKPLEPALAEIDRVDTKEALIASILKFTKDPVLEGAVPVSFRAGPDAKNASDIVAYAGTGMMTLPDRDFYFRDDARSKKIREELNGHIDRMMQLAGVKSADPGKTLLAFETEAASATKTRVERRDPYTRYNKMDVAGLASLAPSVQWKELMRVLRIPENTSVIVGEPDTLKMLEKQLNGAPIETWKLWMKWQILRSSAPMLGRAFEAEDFRFNSQVLQGTKEEQPRWKRCTRQVDQRLGEALGELFVGKHFTSTAQRRMSELVENLRATLREELDRAEWLDAETRKNAVAKLNAFDAKVGFPTKWRDYSKVSIRRDAFLLSVRQAQMVNREFNLSKIGKPVDRTEWGMTPPTVNAYYSPLKNEIVFPAGILQPPFFDVDADDAANYGAIGSVIGHEMGHGFDDQGSKYDFSGNLKNWWTPGDRKKFDERVQCVVDQFNTLDVGDGLRHNGRLVVGEALGDLGGVTLAHKAYRRSLRGKPEPPVLDGYTADQRFFIAFARVWGSHHTPESMRLRLQTDPHPLGKFRANGTLMNVPEFHKAFQCKAGDPMVRPEGQRCRLW